MDLLSNKRVIQKEGIGQICMSSSCRKSRRNVYADVIHLQRLNRNGKQGFTVLSSKAAQHNTMLAVGSPRKFSTSAFETAQTTPHS
uniref:Uncharacterized protein n=1 Tax=Trichuris muris TaxID=70415 RepID=A0A5S6QT78_TRIMR